MPTSIKAAIKKWEEATGSKASEAQEIKLIGVYPPIEKMEGPFHLLVNCEKFSLSTNMISNINNLQAFKKLKILSLGRNVIKNLQVGKLLQQNSRYCYLVSMNDLRKFLHQLFSLLQPTAQQFLFSFKDSKKNLFILLYMTS